MSSETNGGDSFYLQTSTITPSNSEITVNGAVYDYAGSYSSPSIAGTTYGPLTMAYSATADPFAFASETQTWTNCSSACTINIPAYAGRVMYYVVDRKLSNGTVVTGGLQAVPVN